LSISDLLVLMTSFLRDCLPRLADYSAAYSMYSVASTLAPATQAIGCVAQTASVFLTVAMSAHRFVGVCFPFSAHRICTKRNTRILIGSVVGFALLFNLTRAFEVTSRELNCTEELGSMIAEPDARDFRKNPYYITYYIGWAYTIVMYVIPFTLLISLNLKVVLAIKRTSNLHRRMSVKDTKVKEQSKEVSTSIMLVGVVIVFLVCNTPGFLANLIEVLHLVHPGDPVFSKVVDYNNALVVLNASINCFIYMSFSDKYRALLKHYLSCGCIGQNSEPLIDMTMTSQQ
jgi:multisubunit Na+/H+ antiporter MnhB subunit